MVEVSEEEREDRGVNFFLKRKRKTCELYIYVSECYRSGWWEEISNRGWSKEKKKKKIVGSKENKENKARKSGTR